MQATRRIFEDEHEQFREMVARFVATEIAPHHLQRNKRMAAPPPMMPAHLQNKRPVPVGRYY